MDPEEIPAPESSYLRWFYRMSKRINTSLAARTAIFSVVSLFAITREGFPTLLILMTQPLLYIRTNNVC